MLGLEKPILFVDPLQNSPAFGAHFPNKEIKKKKFEAAKLWEITISTQKMNAVGGFFP